MTKDKAIAKSVTIQGDSSTGRVWVNDRELKLSTSLKVWNHSPTGFSWGYAGSGPAQLALAILLAAGLSNEEASRLHQTFKFDKIASLEFGKSFVLIVDMEAWLKEHSI